VIDAAWAAQKIAHAYPGFYYASLQGVEAGSPFQGLNDFRANCKMP
jgi:hypothetical protein